MGQSGSEIVGSESHEPCVLSHLYATDSIVKIYCSLTTTRHDGFNCTQPGSLGASDAGPDAPAFTLSCYIWALRVQTGEELQKLHYEDSDSISRLRRLAGSKVACGARPPSLSATTWAAPPAELRYLMATCTCTQNTTAERIRKHAVEFAQSNTVRA